RLTKFTHAFREPSPSIKTKCIKSSKEVPCDSIFHSSPCRVASAGQVHSSEHHFQYDHGGLRPSDQLIVQRGDCRGPVLWQVPAARSKEPPLAPAGSLHPQQRTRCSAFVCRPGRGGLFSERTIGYPPTNRQSAGRASEHETTSWCGSEHRIARSGFVHRHRSCFGSPA